MPISRKDLADAGSPEALVKPILQAEPNISLPVPIQELCTRLGIASAVKQTKGTTQGEICFIRLGT